MTPDLSPAEALRVRAYGMDLPDPLWNIDSEEDHEYDPTRPL